MYCTYSSPTLTGCTFTGNSAGSFGGGMYCKNVSSATLTNSIMCSNTPQQVFGSFVDNGGNCIQESCVDCKSSECPTDLNGDGFTNGADLGVFFVAWDSCADCPEDFNGDGVVNGEDLGLLFVTWGPCN